VRWGSGYRTTPDPHPVYLYTDDVIGILPERNLNNGQAMCTDVGCLARACAL
jgi:protein-L-isoaspartate(D-aspartate) O-methyltransferase